MPANSYIATMVIPSYWGWTSYTPVIPKLYWDVYSQEERIKRLCKEYDKLTHYASMLADSINDLAANVNDVVTEVNAIIADFKTEVEQQLQDQNEHIEQVIQEQNEMVARQLEDMREYIDMKFDQIAEGQLVYDVTTGAYRPSKQSMRRIAQALAYDHKGDEQLVSFIADNNTVAQLATMTVYHTAYSTRSDIVIDDQIPEGN